MIADGKIVAAYCTIGYRSGMYARQLKKDYGIEVRLVSARTRVKECSVLGECAFLFPSSSIVFPTHWMQILLA